MIAWKGLREMLNDGFEVYVASITNWVDGEPNSEPGRQRIIGNQRTSLAEQGAKMVLS